MTRGTHADAAEREAGFALLVAILFLLAVTAAVAPFVLAARTGFDLASDGLRQDRLNLLADGLVTVLARDLAAPPDGAANRGAFLRSVPAVCRTERLAIEARIQDQRGLVDLNAADEDLLAVAFRSVGMSPAAAADHAKVVLAYRQPEEDEPTIEAGMEVELDPADESLTLDGFKRAPFEAVEELYDFPALRGLPLRTLSETFTIHARQADILGPRMPRGLAAILPERPSPPFPFVVEDEAGAASYRIDVFVRADDATLGYSGAIVAASGNEAGDFEIEERVVNPNFMPGGSPARGDQASCDQLLGASVAAMLRDFSG